jgi:hypothetical protein
LLQNGTSGNNLVVTEHCEFLKHFPLQPPNDHFDKLNNQTEQHLHWYDIPLYVVTMITKNDQRQLRHELGVTTVV